MADYSSITAGIVQAVSASFDPNVTEVRKAISYKVSEMGLDLYDQFDVRIDKVLDQIQEEKAKPASKRDTKYLKHLEVKLDNLRKKQESKM